MAERKSLLLRLDPAVYTALVRWADDDLRSTNAQIEFLLREALARAGRLPKAPGHVQRRSRGPEVELTPTVDDQEEVPQTLIGAPESLIPGRG